MLKKTIFKILHIEKFRIIGKLATKSSLTFPPKPVKYLAAY